MATPLPQNALFADLVANGVEIRAVEGLPPIAMQDVGFHLLGRLGS